MFMMRLPYWHYTLKESVYSAIFEYFQYFVKGSLVHETVMNMNNFKIFLFQLI